MSDLIQFNAEVENKDYSPRLDMSRDEIREFLARVEIEMLKGEAIDIPIKNHFSKNVYAREMTVPKGTMLIGKIHKFENLNIMSKGEVSVISIDGCFRVKAPFTIVGSPGSKRLFYMHEDTVWTTIHGTDKTDVDEIEEEFIAKSYEEVLETKEIKNLNHGGE